LQAKKINEEFSRLLGKPEKKSLKKRWMDFYQLAGKIKYETGSGFLYLIL